MAFLLTNSDITDDFGKKCNYKYLEKTKFNKFVCNDRYAKLSATKLKKAGVLLILVTVFTFI